MFISVLDERELPSKSLHFHAKAPAQQYDPNALVDGIVVLLGLLYFIHALLSGVCGRTAKHLKYLVIARQKNV